MSLTDRPAPVADASRRGRPGLLTLWILLLAAGRTAVDPETDIFWMAREGIARLNGGPLAHADTWSWVAQPWDFVPTSPGWQFVVGWAWQWGGRSGLALVAVLTMAICASVLAWIARQLGAGDTPIVAALLLSALLCAESWTARAALPALVLLLWELAALWRWLQRPTPPTAWRAAPLLAVAAAAVSAGGMWLHNSWTAYAVAAAAGVVWLCANAPYGNRGWRLVMAAAGASGAVGGALLGPFGTSAWDYARRVAESCSDLVVEWSTPWALGPASISLWLVRALLIVACLPLAIRPDRHRALRIALFCAALGCAVVGLRYSRFASTGLLIATPLLAERIARGLRFPATFAQRLGHRLQEPYWRTVLTLLGATMIPLAALALPGAYAAPSNHVYAALPAGCNLFSADGPGSVADLVRPDVRVWMDGRLDYWGRSRIQQLNEYQRQAQSRMVPEGATCAIADVGEEPLLVRALDGSADWQRVEASGDLVAWKAVRP